MKTYNYNITNSDLLLLLPAGRPAGRSSVVVDGVTYRRVGRLVDHLLNHLSAATAGTVPIRAELAPGSGAVRLLLLHLLLLLLLPVLGGVFVEVGHFERFGNFLVGLDFALLDHGYVLGGFRLDVRG